MSLSTAQKEFIQDMMDLYLVPLHSLDDLHNQIKKIKEAFTTAINDTHEFYTLGRYLFAPTLMFKELEKFGDKATIAEVQIYLSEKIIERLSENATVAGLELHELQSLLPECLVNPKNWIPESHFKTYFKTESEKPEVPHLPWERIQDPVRLYYVALSIGPDQRTVSLETKPVDENNSNLMFLNYYLRPYKIIPDGSDQYDFMFDLITQAQQYAVHKMKKMILNYFLEKRFININIFQQAMADKNFGYLVSVKYYFELLSLNFTQTFAKLRNLTVSSASNLCSPVVIHLLHYNYCFLDEAKKFTANQIEIASNYLSKVRTGSLSIEHILNLDSNQCDLLNQVEVINLIQQEKLSFACAEQLPFLAKFLLTSPLYTDYFAKEFICWETIAKLQKYHFDFLLKINGSTLIKQKIISFEDVLSTNERTLQVVNSNNEIYQWLRQKKISFADLKKISSETLTTLKRHPYLSTWITHDIIKINEIHLHEIIDLYSIAYARRLAAIYQKQPYRFGKVEDCDKKILRELRTAAKYLQIDALHLRIHVLKNFINGREPTMKQFTRQIYAEINNLISNRANLSWHEILQQIFTIASNTLENLGNHTNKCMRLFASPTPSSIELQEFCEKIQLITQINVNKPQLRQSYR